MNFKLISGLMAGLLSFLLLVSRASATPITLDFEGATSFSSIDSFYNGGTDSAGQGGPNRGVFFGSDALALSNDALGPYYSNAPTPGTVMTAVGADAALNAITGFTAASFFYSASEATSVGVYSGLNGTGSLLGVFSLLANSQNGCSATAYCHWDLASLSFAGIAKSIQFGTTSNIAGFDNVSIAAVPSPTTAWLMLSGIGGLFAFLRRRRAF